MAEKKRKKESKSQSCLDEDTLSYFKRVENVIEEDDFDDDESRKLFVENVFTQVEGNELELSCDQAMSRVLERLLGHFTDVQIRTMWSNLASNYKVITRDKFGSHVIQNLVNSVPNAIRAERSKIREASKQDKDIDSMEELFLSYCQLIGENLEELVGNTYGSHVVRAVFEVLAGVRVVDSVQRSRNSKGCREMAYGFGERQKFGQIQPIGQAFGCSQAISPSQTIAVPESFIYVLKQLTTSIMEMDLGKLVLHPVSSPVLQTVLLVLHKKNEKLCSKLCKKIVSQSDMFDKKKKTKKKAKESSDKSDGEKNDSGDDDSYHVPPLLSHNIGSHLVEKILHIASPKLHKKLYKSFFKHRLDILALHPVGNYLVQHLLASTTEPTQGGAILDELLAELEDILATGHDGVIARMAETCVRLGVRQQEITTALLDAFHCQESKERKSCAVCILTVTTFDVFFGTEKQENENVEENPEKNKTPEKDSAPPKPRLERISFHGAVLLKTLLEFEDPKVFADSLLGLSRDELVLISSDQTGSHTIETLMRSKTIGDKRKHKLVNKLRGEFAKFACDKQASHVVETCWRETELKYKELISQELADNELQLSKDFYGSKVLKTCGIENFKKKREGWSDRQEKAAKKRQMFEEILNESGAKKERKKAKAKDESQGAQFVASKRYAAEMALLGFDVSGDGEKVENAVVEKDEEKREIATGECEADTRDVIDMIFKAQGQKADDSQKKRKRQKQKGLKNSKGLELREVNSEPAEKSNKETESSTKKKQKRKE